MVNLFCNALDNVLTTNSVLIWPEFSEAITERP